MVAQVTQEAADESRTVAIRPNSGGISDALHGDVRRWWLFVSEHVFDSFGCEQIVSRALTRMLRGPSSSAKFLTSIARLGGKLLEIGRVEADSFGG